ncbi:hypothetical protein H310_07666 [Aphanomyces invadans]|uniref:ubiquitinyl hydrolase 1 n=1 Tax=Aphanomyces invadans TaxID=157072 RepID=A0A024U320_9STRA|nr:hypothetical protein H310_07666 [Aphanomyces invadans]ETW00287.1 hypothetical protein H310_07666 [Aphanomyces invadans]|eukprot:XP_008871312.1 hypothetical protein H310_07666 [Aphanomyces invadans]
MTPLKRKRGVASKARPAVVEDGAVRTADAPSDPYNCSLRACSLEDHHPVSVAKSAPHARKPRAARQRRNCQDNPNCLFGLGEYADGIWKTNPSVLADLGPDPSTMLRSPVSEEDTNNNHDENGARPCGLRNLGATCYVNSMVQCLFMTMSFRRAVHEWEPKETQHLSPVLLAQMQALQRLFAHMQLGARSFADPQEFASKLELNNVVQQDAHEFTKLLLTHLQSIFVYSKHRAHWNHIDSHFRGSMHYVTTCGTCHARSTKSSSFFELSVNIKGHSSIHHSFQSYLAPEILDGDNRYYCDTCHGKQDASRHIEIEPATLPPTLMLHLMRFVYDVKSNTKKKVQDAIEIPLELCMSDLTSAIPPTSSSQGRYRLVGVLNHRGTTASAGHYTANLFHPTSGNWFSFDDTQVSPIEPASFLASKEAYMLIYTRVNENASGLDDDAAAMPAPRLVAEVEAANTQFLQDIATYKNQVAEVTESIDIRKAKYEYHFESPVGGKKKVYWVHTATLKDWVVGDDLGSHPRPPVDMNPYVCPHGHLRPDKCSHLKRVSEPLYRELCSASVAPNALSSDEFWCDECVATNATKSLASQSHNERLKRNLELLCNSTDEHFVISRKWIASWKVCLQDALAIKQQEAKVHEAQEWLASMAINQDIQCTHGNLQPKSKKQVRGISSELWAVLATEYTVSAVFPKQSTVECQDCVTDASTQQAAETRAQNKRNELMAKHPALVRLYKRSLDHLETIPVNQPVVLVSMAWLETWKHSIDHVLDTAPQQLPPCPALCEHGKCVVPGHVLDQLDRRHLKHKLLQHTRRHGSSDATMVFFDEWEALHHVYKSSSRPLSFVVEDGQHVRWGQATRDGFVDMPSLRCTECELKQQTNRLARAVDFQDELVTVIFLREEEAIPSTRGGAEVVGADQQQRRRSSRSSRRTNPTFEVPCSADDTVSLLKHRIYERCDTAPSHHLLYFNGDLLDNATSLKHAGIRAHDSLYLKVLTDETPADVLDLVTNESEIEVGFQHSAISGHRRTSVSSSWVCEECTFVNDTSQSNVCEMCLAVRPS